MPYVSTRFTRWAALPIRAIAGYGFLVHGLAKLQRGPDAFAGVLAALHVPWPAAAAWLTIATEVAGGAALLAGAFISLVSIPLAIVMLTAMWTVHRPFGFSSIKLVAVTAAGPQFGPPGIETALLYLASLATLALIGPDPLAWDAIARRP
jgi:putative oxidoreductase